MRALVTGATGAFGGALARRLCARGDRVRVFARSSAKLEQLGREGCEVYAGDLRDAAAVASAVGGCDVVFHVGALFQTAKAPDREFFEVNVGGTRHLLDAARRHAVRYFLHTSTIGVHGSIAQPPADESAPFAPGDPYRESKLEAEQLARSYFEAGLAGCVIRPTAIYGPGDLRFLKLFRGVQSGWFAMLGSGSARLHMVYVDDLVDAALRCAENPAGLNEVFIIGGARAVTIDELVRSVAASLHVRPPRWRLPLLPFQVLAPAVQRICRAAGVEPPLHPRRLHFFTDDRAFDISKARRVLGFQPRVDLEEGLARTRDWYWCQGLLRRDSWSAAAMPPH
jgi:nucleoside-diphosphate-sugar epimerase